MAFETGSATDVYDLLDKIRVFASAQGWTVNASSTDELYLQNGASYWALKAVDDLDNDTGGVVNSFRARHPGIAVYGATGFDSGATWDQQPGNSGTGTAIGAFEQINVPAYWFFADTGGTYIHIVARPTAGRYGHLALGDLEKLGSWTGGQYLAGTVVGDTGGFVGQISFEYHSLIRADIDGATDAWQTVDTTSGGNLEAEAPFHYFIENDDRSELLGSLLAAGPAEWNGRAPMWPLYVLLQRPDSRHALAGYPNDMRALNIKLLQPEQTVVVGSDEWLIFPILRKSDVGEDGSRWGGYAYRKVT